MRDERGDLLRSLGGLLWVLNREGWCGVQGAKSWVVWRVGARDGELVYNFLLGVVIVHNCFGLVVGDGEWCTGQNRGD